MSRPRSVPTYRKHKQSGQAVVTLTDDLGSRRDVLLGKYGTAASRTEYARVLAEWEASSRRLPQKPIGEDATVNELAAAFWDHVEQHYRRPDGTATSEVEEYKRAIRPTKHLYGERPVSEFGPLALKAVRQLLIDGYSHPKYGPQDALARGVVNQRIGRVRRMFKWGVEQEMVPPAVLQGLQAVRGLQRGRSQAKETKPVSPVAVALVEETVPHMNRQIAALVRVQLLTGMRPGEVVLMRACDLEMSGKVWIYRPGSDAGAEGQHKTAHHGHQRVIAIGPRAQEVIRPFLKLDTRAYLFSPREAIAEFRARRRKDRKSKVQPSQQNRRKRKPRKQPGERYTTSSYAHAIKRAITTANTTRACDACKDLRPAERCEACRSAGLPSWHPHQLRHTKATELRREFGLDAARVVLGHRTPAITEHYAELDVGKAVEVMEKMG